MEPGHGETDRDSASVIIGIGDFEYAIPFYHERRPFLIVLVFAPDEVIGAKNSFVDTQGERITAETINASPAGIRLIKWRKAVPLHDTRVTIIGDIKSIRDITDRRDNEMKLARGKASLGHHYRLHPGSLFISSTGPGGISAVTNS